MRSGGKRWVPGHGPGLHGLGLRPPPVGGCIGSFQKPRSLFLLLLPAGLLLILLWYLPIWSSFPLIPAARPRERGASGPSRATSASEEPVRCGAGQAGQ